jgi:CysZ protein
MKQFITGISYFIAGLRLITQPGLRRFVFLPLCINIIFFMALFFVLRHYTREFDTWFVNYLPGWLHWLSVVLWMLFFMSFLLIFIYTFIIAANVFAAPFNSLLAEKVEFYLTGNAGLQHSWQENIKDVPRVIGRQLKIIAYYLPRMLLILVLFFITIVQAVAALLWFIFNAWFMTLTYTDYPTDNHKIPLTQLQQRLKQKRWLTLGFGASVLVFAMVPVLNFFTMPAAVAGATKLWLEEGGQ